MIPTIFNFVFPIMFFFGCWDVGKRWLKFQHGSHGVLFLLSILIFSTLVFSVVTRSFLPAPVEWWTNVSKFVFVLCGFIAAPRIFRELYANKWETIAWLALFLPVFGLIVFQEKYDWDDYSHWLPISKQLISTGDFITLNNFSINNAQPAYPAGLAVIIALVHFDLNSFEPKYAVFTTNVFIFLFLKYFSDLTKVHISTLSGPQRMLAVYSLYLLISFLFSWYQFSAYADIPLSVLLVVGATSLIVLINYGVAFPRRDAVLLILGTAVAVPLIKNYGQFLFAFLCGVVFIASAPKLFSRNEIQTNNLFSVVLAALLLTFGSEALWQFSHESSGLFFPSKVRAFEEWHFSLLVLLLDNLFEWFLVPRNGFVLILCILPFFVSPKSIVLYRTVESTLVRSALLFLIVNSVVLLIFYLSVLSEDEGRRFLSAERYLMPSLLLVCLATGVWIAFHFSKYTLYATRTIIIPSIVFLFFFACIQLQAQLSSQRDVVGVGKYQEIVYQANKLTENKSVLFVTGDQGLLIPRLIFLLPDGVKGSWMLRHDIARFENEVKSEDQLWNFFKGTEPKPDVICFTGSISNVSDTKDSWIALLAKNGPNHCYPIAQLIKHHLK